MLTLPPSWCALLTYPPFRLKSASHQSKISSANPVRGEAASGWSTVRGTGEVKVISRCDGLLDLLGVEVVHDAILEGVWGADVAGRGLF